MKRQLKLLILAGVLVLCVVGYSLISSIGDKQTASSTVQNTDITVTEFSAADVAQITWEYEDGTYRLLKTDSFWQNQADKTFPVAQNYVATMSTQIAGMTASRKISDVSDLAQYGLDAPQLAVSIMTANGGELSFVFGAENTVTGEYYMQYSEGETFTGSNDVYLVNASVVGAFSYHMDDLVQLETLPVLNTTTSVKVEANETYRVSYMGEDAAFPWILRDADNSKRTANTELCEQLVNAIAGMQLADCVEFNAANADLSLYGLDEPWATVTVEYAVSGTDESGNPTASTDTFAFILGNVDENGNYYMLSEELGMLYAVTPDVGDFIKANNIATITDISNML